MRAAVCDLVALLLVHLSTTSVETKSTVSSDLFLLPHNGSAIVGVESVVLVGQSNATRMDPVAMSFAAKRAEDALVLCATDSQVMISTNGGGSFERHMQFINGHESASLPHIRDIGSGPIGLGDTRRTTRGAGVPQGYQTSALTGPWQTTSVGIITADTVARNVTFKTEVSPSSQAHWAAPPHEIIMFSLAAGGVTQLDSGGLNFLATAAVRYGTHELPGPTHRGHCCNNSVVAYASTDGGRHWSYRSTIASKASVNAAGWSSQEGPNENDVVLMSDQQTLFSIIRKDGGDGYPDHAHVPYLLAKSTDQGFHWSVREAPAQMLSARPRMVALSGGALIVTGGRPALNMWVSVDQGNSFDRFDIPTLHNQHIDEAADRFCDAFEDANATLGWAESSCYTQVMALDSSHALLCYERQGAGSGGYDHHHQPKECNPKGSAIFCMRVHVDAA
jgi:hypothetical protein